MNNKTKYNISSNSGVRLTTFRFMMKSNEKISHFPKLKRMRKIVFEIKISETQ